MNKRRLSLFLIVSWLLLGTGTAVFSQGSQIHLLLQSVENDDTPLVRDDAFPLLSLDVVPVNEFAVPIVSLQATDFAALEDGLPINNLTIEPLVDPGESLSIMLVIDSSTPTRDQFSQMRAAAINLYSTLEPNDESGVVAFALGADGVGVNLSEPFPILTTGRELGLTYDEGALINLLNGLQVAENSGTPLYDALYKGIRMAAAGRFQRRAVVLLTNGRDTAADGVSRGSQFVTADMVIEEARRSRIPVFALAWGDTADTDFLQRAATFTGGAYRQTTTSEEMAAFLREMAGLLRHKYRLSYQSALPADNTPHQITISLPTQPAAPQPADFVARYALAPQFTAVTLIPHRGSALPLSASGGLQGQVAFEASVSAREPVTAVNYYLNDNQTAIFAATAPPWHFDWQTADLPPGAYKLTLEAIDAANPPHVGLFETTVQIVACPALCQMEQKLGLNPLYLGGGFLLLLLAAVGGWWAVQRRQRPSTPAYTGAGSARGSAAHNTPDWLTSPASPKPLPPQPAARAYTPPTPAAQHRPPSASANIPAPLLSDLPPAAGSSASAGAAAGSADKTEVLQFNPNRLAFLVDTTTGQGFRLSGQMVIGSAAACDICLPDASIAERHAHLFLEGDHFTLTVQTSAHITRVNGRDDIRWLLQDGDQIQIGLRTLIFKLVK